MNEQEILSLIYQGENQTIEFKREEENNRDFAKIFSAFANSSSGGILLVGVDDSGEIVGISTKDKLMLKLNDIAFNRCKPPVSIFINCVSVSGKEVMIVNIPSGMQKPYKVDGITYIRSNNQTREASREEELRLYQSSFSIFFDETPVYQANLDDINFNLFKKFIKEYIDDLISFDKQELKNYLRNFHLITNEDIPTITGLLFFCDNSQRFLPYAKIVCAAYNDTDISGEPFDKKELIGTIPSIIEQIETFLKIHLKNKHKIKDFLPEEVTEIPLTALRELIVNAIAHRDYTIYAPIRILIFLDRIEIHSPGLLPNTVTIESIKVGGSHVLRNPTIYNLLVKMKMVTDLGSGVKRANRIIKKQTGKDIILELSENEFIVKILRD